MQKQTYAQHTFVLQQRSQRYLRVAALVLFAVQLERFEQQSLQLCVLAVLLTSNVSCSQLVLPSDPPEQHAGQLRAQPAMAVHLCV